MTDVQRSGAGVERQFLGVALAADIYVIPLTQGASYTSASGTDYMPPIPEPPSLILLATAIIALLGFADRRRRRSGSTPQAAQTAVRSPIAAVRGPWWTGAKMSRIGPFFAAALIALAYTNGAHATLLDFDFSFTNDFGNTSGTVTGEIEGLTDNATSAASAVLITSAPPAFSYLIAAYPFDTTSCGACTVDLNGFTVAGGVITSDDYTAYISGATWEGCCDNLELQAGGGATFGDLEVALTEPGTALTISHDVTYTAASVPEPASLALLATALAALWPVRRRQRRKAP